MASNFVARALQLLYSSAVGAILQLFFAYLCSAIEKLVDHESNLRSLESTLELINYAFPDSGSSLRPEALSLSHMIEEGLELIHKGSRVRRWNVLKMWYYSTKINKLQASLDRFILNHVVVFGFQKTERTSEVVINLEGKMNTMIEVANDIATMTRRQMGTSEQVRVGSSDTVVGFECGAAKQIRDKSFTEIIVASRSGWSGRANTMAESLSR